MLFNDRRLRVNPNDQFSRSRLESNARLAGGSNFTRPKEEWSTGERVKSFLTGRHPDAVTAPKKSTFYTNTPLSNEASLYHTVRKNKARPLGMSPNMQKPLPPTPPGGQ